MSEKNEKDEMNSRHGIAREVIKISPHYAWMVLAISAVYYFHEPILDLFKSDRVRKLSISVFSVELSEAKNLSDEPIDVRKLSALDARAAHVSDYIEGARILWVDDLHPNQNVAERKAFEELGIVIDLAESTNEALAYLNLNVYDAVITDLKREKDSLAECQRPDFLEAGCDLLRRMSEQLGEKLPRTLIYASNIQPEYGMPPFASGMTNRIEELVHLVLDSLERRDIKISHTE